MKRKKRATYPLLRMAGSTTCHFGFSRRLEMNGKLNDAALEAVAARSIGVGGLANEAGVQYNSVRTSCKFGEKNGHSRPHSGTDSDPTGFTTRCCSRSGCSIKR